MPEYTYRCTQCSHEFDTVHSILQDSLKTCPSCTQDTLRKVINSVPGIAFKGSGFYVTDNNKQATKTPAPKSDSENKSADSKGAETNLETASAAKESPAETKSVPVAKTEKSTAQTASTKTTKS